MVARNHCLMKLRDKNVIISADEKQQLQAEDEDKSIYLDKEKNLTAMETSINELCIEQKTCITLFYLQKQSYQTIANTTGYSMMQVKSHIQNGKRNLKLLVEKKLNII